MNTTESLTSLLSKWVDSTVQKLRNSNEPVSLADAYDYAFDKTAIIESILKPLSEEIEKVKKVRLPEMFTSHNLKSLTTTTGYRITVSQKMYAGFKADSKEIGLQWLRDNNAEDLIQETVNSQSLSRFAKDLIEEGRELPEDIFNVAIVPNTSRTKV